MVHFTCDLCGKDLPAKGSPRFVVRITISPVNEFDALHADDHAEDSFEAISQLIHDAEETNGDANADAHNTPTGHRFDLCPECQKRFAKDPLSRAHSWTLEFSKN